MIQWKNETWMKMVMQGHFSLVCTVTYDEHKIVRRTNCEWSTLYVVMLIAQVPLGKLVGVYCTRNPVHLLGPNTYPNPCVLSNLNFLCHVFQLILNLTEK